MKKMIMLLVAVTFVTTAVFAQGNAPAERKKKTPEERADSCASRMERDFGLNADQKNRVRALALTRSEKMNDLRAKYKGNDAEKEVWRTERKKVEGEFSEGLKATLSAEQYAKWEEQQKARAQQRHHHAGKHAKGKCSGADSAKPKNTSPAPGK